jgi:hypothetical protein
MNDLCNGTLGKGLDFGNKIIRFARRRQTKEFDTKIAPQLWNDSTLTREQIAEMVRELNEFGFTRLPAFISREAANRICKEIHSTHGKDASGTRYKDIDEWVATAKSGRIDSNEAAVLKATSCEYLNFSGIALIAREYLGASPMLLGPHSWTTRYIAEKSDFQIEQEAMAYHCDSDFFDFVKVFLLVTDVRATNGPFTFISGSHKGKRHVQGRVTDAALDIRPGEELFGVGKAGDVVLAATKGWHKATPPQEGMRTMVQWLYSNGLLGSTTQ